MFLLQLNTIYKMGLSDERQPKKITLIVHAHGCTISTEEKVWQCRKKKWLKREMGP